jgi:hypothetical protein
MILGVDSLTNWGLLNFKDKEEGIQEVILNVKKLMEDRFEDFSRNFPNFRRSDSSDMSQICRMEGDFLVYETESIHPKERKTGRTPLLLLFGNPAPHSIKNRMFFSYERNGKEHRFWKVLSESEIFRLDEQIDDINERNRLKKKKLLEANYDPPFQIYLDVFYSMPSPATGKWSGVAGLKRLFGTKALKKITELERQRIRDAVSRYICPNGLILAFQKDAYVKIKSENSPDYDIARKQAMEGNTQARCQFDNRIKLYCMAPTRLMYKNHEALHKLKKEHEHS